MVKSSAASSSVSTRKSTIATRRGTAASKWADSVVEETPVPATITDTGAESAGVDINDSDYLRDDITPNAPRRTGLRKFRIKMQNFCNLGSGEKCVL